MKRAFLTFLLAGAFFNIAQATVALDCSYGFGCSAPTGAGTEAQHRIYAGLAWKLSNHQNFWPTAALGIRALRTYANNAVNGFDLSVSANIRHTLKLDNTRLVYVSGGSRLVQSNVGLGYSFQKNAFLGTAAIQATHARFGIDYFLNQNIFSSYVEGNTLTKNAPALHCDSGALLMPVEIIPANAAIVKNGKTCINNIPAG